MVLRSDVIIPVSHATHAARRIGGAELMVVEPAHHILSLSRSYGPVARRELQLALG